MSEKLIGKIKMFHPNRGYGFIKTDDKEIFFHVSGLIEENKKIEMFEEVEFEIENTDKGDKAINIQRINQEK